MDYLKGGDPAEEFFKNLKVKSQNFNGFNFLGIERSADDLLHYILFWFLNFYSDKNDRYRLVTFTSKFVDELKPLVWNASG
jgi:hypothetical protein